VQANTGDSRFLLLGSMGSGHPSVLNPNADPVHMTISYGKSSEGQQQVLVIIPGGLLQTICLAQLQAVHAYLAFTAAP